MGTEIHLSFPKEGPHISEASYRLVLVPLLLLLALLGGGLLQLLRVLQQQRVAQAGPQEQVAGLHGHHLVEGRAQRCKPRPSHTASGPDHWLGTSTHYSL